MAELRLIALSEKSSDIHMLEAMRFACSHANRDYYVGKCSMSSANPEVELYAEIIYLLNELAEHGTKNGLNYAQVELRRFKQTLQDLLPEHSVRDAQFHEERFWAIQKEEDKELRDRRREMEDGWNPLQPLISLEDEMYGVKKKRRNRS